MPLSEKRKLLIRYKNIKLIKENLKENFSFKNKCLIY